jgi:hypothetical protein
MDRITASASIKSGLAWASIALAMFGLVFVAAFFFTG